MDIQEPIKRPASQENELQPLPSRQEGLFGQERTELTSEDAARKEALEAVQKAADSTQNNPITQAATSELMPRTSESVPPLATADQATTLANILNGTLDVTDKNAYKINEDLISPN